MGPAISPGRGWGGGGAGRVGGRGRGGVRRRGLGVRRTGVGGRGAVPSVRCVCHGKCPQELQYLADGPFHQVADGGSADSHGPPEGAKARACAVGAGAPGHVLLELRAHVLRGGFAVPAFDVGDDALPVVLVVALHLPGVVGEADLHPCRPVQQGVARGLGQVPPGDARVELVGLGQPRDHGAAQVPAGLPPGDDHALQQRERRTGEEERAVDLAGGAQAAAAGAGPVRGVEGEHPRLQLGEAGPALRAGVVLAEEVGDVVAAAPFDDLHHSLGGTERGLHRVGEPRAVFLPHRQPVHDDPDVVVLVAVQAGDLAEVVDPAVDKRPREAVAACPVEEIAELALAAPHQRRHHLDARALLHFQHTADDMGGGLPPDGQVAFRAVGRTHAGVKQSQVVINLGYGTDGGTRVARHRLLLDRDGRREPLDGVHVGLLHQPQELPRIRRQRLDVAALALGVDGVEGQRRLPRPRQPRHDHEALPRDIQRDVPQVVLPGPADDELQYPHSRKKENPQMRASWREMSSSPRYCSRVQRPSRKLSIVTSRGSATSIRMPPLVTGMVGSAQ